MNLLCTGDWHLRIKPPQNRLGDYYGDQMAKLEWVLETALQHGCSAILQPGDLGDSATWSDYLKTKVIGLLKHYDIPLLAVFGQHDQKYHSMGSAERTSLRVLEAAGVVNIVGEKPYKMSGINIYGASYGKEVPTVKGGAINVLLIHRMILRDSKSRIWAGQRDYAVAEVFLRNHPEFDLVVSGDNHNGFVAQREGRVLVNCGALMRTVASREQVEHRPFTVLYNTEKRTAEQLYVPVRPAEEVLDREKVEEAHERDERLEAFVRGLSEDYAVELDFRKNLDEFLAKNEVGEGVMEVLGEVLDD